MANLTPNLALFKYDEITDADQVFSFEQALNDNWDIIDALYPQLALKTEIPTDYCNRNLSNLTSTGKYVIPGKFTSQYAMIAESFNLYKDDGNPFYRTVSLPDDNCYYMVFLRGLIDYSNGNYTNRHGKLHIGVGNNLGLGAATYMCSMSYRVANQSFTTEGFGIVILKYGSNNLQINRSTDWYGSATLEQLGYYRLGKF